MVSYAVDYIRFQSNSDFLNFKKFTSNSKFLGLEEKMTLANLSVCLMLVTMKCFAIMLLMIH